MWVVVNLAKSAGRDEMQHYAKIYVCQNTRLGVSIIQRVFFSCMQSGQIAWYVGLFTGCPFDTQGRHA